MQSSIIKRYVAPTSLDNAAFGTQWKVIIDDNENYELFIQLSKDERNPQWKRLGEFLEKTFEEFLNDPNFLNQCFKIYQYNLDRPFFSINKIISDR